MYVVCCFALISNVIVRKMIETGAGIGETGNYANFIITVCD